MIYFLIPVYNEEANVPMLAASLLALNLNAKYIFVDDGSSDQTADALTKAFEKPGKLVLLRNEINLGPGSCFNKGFEWLLENVNEVEKNYVITLEGDNTSDLSILPAMISLAENGNELVLASAYMQGGGFSQSSAWRKAISNVANGLTRRVFKIKIQTLTSFYRIYDLELIRKIKNRFNVIAEEKGFICKVELLLKARACGASIIEYPVTLQSHLRKGKSKMKILKTGLNYIGFILSNRKKY